MTRLEKLLAGVLLFLVGLVAVLLFLFWQQSRTAPRLLEQAPPLPTPPPAATALENHQIAQAGAETWAPDARLLQARGNWPTNSVAPGDSSWVFLFYSSARAETGLISVHNGQAQLVSSNSTAQPQQPLALDAWQVDSPAVVDTVLEQGGRDFLNAHNDVELILSLSTNREMIWTAVLIAQDTNELFQLQIDPASGQILAAP